MILSIVSSLCIIEFKVPMSVMFYVDSLFPKPNDWNNLIIFFFYFYISDCSECFLTQVIHCFFLAVTILHLLFYIIIVKNE